MLPFAKSRARSNDAETCPMTRVTLLPGLLKAAALGAGLALSGCTTVPWSTGETVSKEVQVLGRTWTVTELPGVTNGYIARRDNNNLNPFGRPAALRTPQAVRALQTATGCRVVRGKLWQNTSAEYYAEMSCPG